MRLDTLLSVVVPLRVEGNLHREIADIQSDSRHVVVESLFVAVRGTTSDGHAYIQMAIEKGAIAVVCETMPDQISEQITYVLVADSADALGRLASQWYGNPSSQLILTGVTGTNGKTTTATLLYEMFRLFGYKVGLLSTVCNYIDNEPFEATHTTPDPIALNALMRRMVDSGCQYAFMEVSSHSADQKRIAGLRFAGAVFTNLTRDHLDYHKTVDAYLKAKKSFFDALPADAFALTNVDDKNGMVMMQNTKAKVLTYSLRMLADFKARILESHFDGMLLEINGRELFVQFVGRFNAYNLLAVYGATLALGRSVEEVLLAMSRLVPVSGRFQTIRSSGGVTAIVDYAHTPDALTNVLGTINDVLKGRGAVITVVGAGGNRDKGKRPLMAQESVKASDRLILTSDNPRFEEPQDILNDMLAGLDADERRRTLVIVDRGEAIRTAVALAQSGDVILVAGKGHETYQDVKGVKHHFDDREILTSLFAAK